MVGECGHKDRSLYSSKIGWLCENCLERYEKEALKASKLEFRRSNITNHTLQRKTLHRGV